MGLRSRQKRLPKGLGRIWARLSGQHARLMRDMEKEAEACGVRDRREMEALIDRHLAERRIFEAEQAQLSLADDIRRAFKDGVQQSARRTYAPDPLQPLILPPDDVPFSRAQIREKPDRVLDVLADKNATFTRNDILRALAVVFDDPIELRATSERTLCSPDLIRLSNNDPAIYSTRGFETAKTDLSACMDEMTKSGGFKVSRSEIDQAIAAENARLRKRYGATLSDQQVEAVRHVLKPNQMSAVVGLAGAGKSTLLAVARQVWERSGYRVHGAALAGKAADSLQSASGMRSRTLASLEASWMSGYEPVGHGDIVVIDEAGMVGTRQLARVAEALRQRGCKLVLVGDPDQLQPIQAGTPFKDIIVTGEAARLSEIRRQTAEWQRRASEDLAAGRVQAALLAYEDHGAVHIETDRDHAIAALVDDYVADMKLNGSTASRLALAHRRKDVYAINQAVKCTLREMQEPKTELLILTEHGPRAFGEGDRILFMRNDVTLGVRNGMLGTIKKVGDDQLVVALDPDDAGNRRTVTFDPRIYPSIDHGFAVSIHRAQGCTVDRSFVLSSTTLDTNLAYVAMTRHRTETGFYTAPDIQHRRHDGRRRDARAQKPHQMPRIRTH